MGDRGEDLARIIEWEDCDSLFDEEFKEVENSGFKRMVDFQK